MVGKVRCLLMRNKAVIKLTSVIVKKQCLYARKNF